MSAAPSSTGLLRARRGEEAPRATPYVAPRSAALSAVRIAAVARIECLRIARDRTSLSLLLVVPALQIALFGYAVRPETGAIPLAIARETTEASDRLRRAIDASGAATVVADGLAAGEAVRMVERGDARLAIELPRIDYFDPEASIERPRVVADASDPAAVRSAIAALETAYWREAATRGAAITGAAAPAAVDVERLYDPDGRAAWAIVPGLAGVVAMISMLMLGALTLVRERERGTWEALLATPVGAADALVGKLAPYVVLGTAQAAITIAAGHILFDVPLRGAVWALLLAMPLYAAAHLVLGFALSALAETSLQALQGAVVFYLPCMLLSGFLFPFDAMPGWAKHIGEAIPLTHFVRASRGVLLRGEGAALVAREMMPVAAFAVVAAAIALGAYRRRLD
jgi:ABC-2 type transport system permease protein